MRKNTQFFLSVPIADAAAVILVIDHHEALFGADLLHLIEGGAASGTEGMRGIGVVAAHARNRDKAAEGVNHIAAAFVQIALDPGKLGR